MLQCYRSREDQRTPAELCLLTVSSKKFCCSQAGLQIAAVEQNLLGPLHQGRCQPVAGWKESVLSCGAESTGDLAVSLSLWEMLPKSCNTKAPPGQSTGSAEGLAMRSVSANKLNSILNSFFSTLHQLS